MSRKRGGMAHEPAVEKPRRRGGKQMKTYVAAEDYHPSVYAKRNRCMVEQSDRVTTVYDGREKGGTVGTIRLAHTMKKKLREIAIGELNVPQHLIHFK